MGVSVSLEELYNLALAYVAEGFRSQSPQHILIAEEVFEKIALTAAVSNHNGYSVSVEMGLCSLLLGETDKALNCLGLSVSAPAPPDRKVLAFVKVRKKTKAKYINTAHASSARWACSR